MLAGFSYHHAARGTNKQSCPELVFQLADLHADGRLRYVDAQTTGCKSAEFGDGYKGAKLSNFHSGGVTSGDKGGYKLLLTTVIVIIKSFSFHYKCVLPRMLSKMVHRNRPAHASRLWSPLKEDSQIF